MWSCTMVHGGALRATYRGYIVGSCSRAQLLWKEVALSWHLKPFVGYCSGGVGNEQIEALEFKAAFEWKQLTFDNSPLSWSGEDLHCLLCQEFTADYQSSQAEGLKMY